MTHRHARPVIVRARVIHTMDPQFPQARAMVILGDRIAAVGDPADLAGLFPHARHADFGDRVVVPGFNDAHQHLCAMAATADHLDLGTPDRADRARALRDLADLCARTPPGQWVRAFAYDHTDTGQGPLTRTDLDAVSVHHPILISHVSDHWGVLNSLGLARTAPSAGPPHDNPPAGGPDGRIYEADFFRLALADDDTLIDQPTPERHLRGLEDLTRRHHAAGITSIGDALVTPAQLAIYQRARHENRLTLRVGLLLDATHADDYLDLGIGSGMGDTMLRIGGFKAIADGSIAGRTCLLEAPYSDAHDPEDRGLQVTDPEELTALTRRVHDAGSVIAIHANGDRAIAQALDAIETAQAHGPTSHTRHRVEHCTVLTPSLVTRLKATGTAAVPFGAYISHHGPKLLRWYGPERLNGMFAHRWLLDAGVPVGGSSDYSASPFEPLIALHSMITRRSADGTVLGAQQRVTAAEALWIYTAGSATVAGEEHIKGRLSPGYLADFVVLDEDPLTVSVDDLPTVGVHQTVVGGHTVWSTDDSANLAADTRGAPRAEVPTGLEPHDLHIARRT